MSIAYHRGKMHLNGFAKGNVGSRLLAAAVCSTVLVACGGDQPAGPDAAPERGRSFALGFTDFPHAKTLEAVLDAFNVIERDGDMAVMHFDDGVPWPEALAGAPYAPEYRNSLDQKAAFIPDRHMIYLAVTPINFERNGLASYRGVSGSEPLEPPWDRRSFDHPDVMAAFLAHCEKMIEIYFPHYFAFAIEANILLATAPDKWPAFIRFAEVVYSQLKVHHPELPIFITLQIDFFHADPVNQTNAIAEVLPYTDYIAVSTYPFSRQANPQLLREDHFTAAAALAPNKPFAVAETVWPAENVTDPYPTFIPANEENQRIYTERLLTEADRLSAVFVNWFFTRDYDALWVSDMQFLDNASLLRLWKDTGLYTGDGNPRPALGAWREWLVRSRR